MSPAAATRILFAFLVGTGIADLAPGADKKVSVERYDVDARLHANGDLEAEERVVFQLSGGPFTRVYRDLSPANADHVEVVGAVGDGQQLSDPSLTQRRTARALHVEWRFPAVSDTTRTLVLRYRVTGAASRSRREDRLSWSPLPARHDYDIERSEVTVRWPELEVAPGRVSTRRGEDVRVEQSTQADRARFVTSNLRRHDGYQIRLDFPPGTFAGSMPAWQRLEAEASRRAADHARWALALFLVTTLPLGLYWWQHRSSSPSHPPTAASLAIPSTLPVGLAAALRERRGRPPRAAIWGALMSLARQGYVALEGLEGEGRAGVAFRATRLRVDDPVHEHERTLLTHIFDGAAGVRAGQPRDITRAALEGAQRRFGDGVWADLARLGYIDAGRVAARRVLRRAAWLMLAVGGASTVAAGVIGVNIGLGASLMLVPLGLVASAGAAALLATGISPLSDAGLAEGQRWTRLARGLSDVARSGRRAAGVDWASALPVATAFGLGGVLAGRSVELGLDVPAWFTRHHHSRDADGHSDPWLTFLSASVPASGGDASDAGASACGADGGGGGASGAD